VSAPCRVSPGDAGEVDRDMGAVEPGLDVRPQPDRAFGLGAHVGAAALPADDQPVVAQDP